MLVAMVSFAVDLEVQQGASFSRSFTWEKAGQPVDLTGCSARMQVREDIGTDVLLELTTENGGIVLGGLAGTVDVRITPEQSAAFAWRAAMFDLKVTLTPLQQVRRLLAGRVTVTPQVTT